MNNQQLSQLQTLQQKNKQLQKQIESQGHEHKKILLQAKTQLQFQRNRADQFQEKYKGAIRYQNQEKELKKILNQLDQKLGIKENQILELLKAQQEKKKKISELNDEIQDLKNQNDQFKERLQQFQKGAVSAILQKDSIINQLQQRIVQLESHTNGESNLGQLLIEVQQKYKQLENRAQANRIQLQGIIQSKDEQISEISDKFEKQKQKFQERVNRYEQQIADYEKHIEHLNEEKYQEQSLQEKYYQTQDKLRKTQKKLHQTQLLISDQRKQFLQSTQKLTHELEELKSNTQQIKLLKLKTKQFQKQIKDKQKNLDDMKTSNQKHSNELSKKILHLETEKKKLLENIDIKNMEIQRLRIQIQQKINDQKLAKAESDKNKNVPRSSLAAEIQNVQVDLSPVKMIKKESEQTGRIVQKLKNDIKQLEQNNKYLSKKLEEQTKQIQELRQRLVQTSGSASRSSEQQKYLVTIEDLHSHIKKVQNNLMIHKLKYAQDESYWNLKQKSYKQQITISTKQFKKQKSELLQRIDRMKKSGGKDRKMDYYQSGFK